MNEWFRSPLGWTAFGFLGQFLFSSRFLVQWLASEREGRAGQHNLSAVAGRVPGCVAPPGG